MLILHTEVHTSMMYDEIITLLQLCDLPFTPVSRELAHHNGQGGSSETATSMLTLNVSCSGLHCTEPSPPADNRPQGQNATLSCRYI